MKLICGFRLAILSHAVALTIASLGDYGLRGELSFGDNEGKRVAMWQGSRRLRGEWMVLVAGKNGAAIPRLAGAIGVRNDSAENGGHEAWYSRILPHHPEWLRNTVLVVVVSTGLGLFLATADFFHGGGDSAGFFNKLLSAWVWAPLVPLVLAIDRRLPLSEKQFHLRLGIHVILSLPWAMVHTALLAVAELPFKSIYWNPLLTSQYTYYYIATDWFSYWTIFALVFALRYYRRYTTSQLEFERLRNRFLQVHLDYLRMQLEPHFISNALNAIASTTETDPPLARRIIADLGVLLRLSHEYKDRQLVPLKEELSILEHYIAIQRVRFGDCIEIEINIAPEAEYVLVPCLLLQPLVENAIRHGLRGKQTGGTIIITADRIGDIVEIRIDDNGAGLPPGWKLETSPGQGLTITRERLAALFPDGNARIAIDTRPSGGTEVLVGIPIQSGGENR